MIIPHIGGADCKNPRRNVTFTDEICEEAVIQTSYIAGELDGVLKKSKIQGRWLVNNKGL